jgi:hypothetical protein
MPNDLYLAAVAEIARLRAALKPFSDMATVALRTPGDCAFGTMSVEIDHLIRAKAALEPPSHTEPAPESSAHQRG